MVADLAHLSRLTATARRIQRRSLVILCYHRVLPAETRRQYPFPGLVVTPELFARQVEFCRRHYDCMPLREAVETLTSAPRPRRPLLAFTFDDGYRDNFEHARPTLNAHDIRATFFVISALVGSRTPPWYDRLGRALTHLRNAPRDVLSAAVGMAEDHEVRLLESCLNGRSHAVSHAVNMAKCMSPHQRATVVARICEAAKAIDQPEGSLDCIMTRDQLAQLDSEGHEIASHSRLHPILTQLPPEELAQELSGSRSELCAMIAGSVTSLAYPNGDHSDEVVAAADRFGYQRAVTGQSGLNHARSDPLRLRRIFVSQERMTHSDGACSTNILEMELTGLADRMFLRRYRRQPVA
jgi:peptidoglycan/xylan/chitin deacetylase (PgdA/CDA1 family)